jgi:fatty-acyl-CoA synthase
MPEKRGESYIKSIEYTKCHYNNLFRRNKMTTQDYAETKNDLPFTISRSADHLTIEPLLNDIRQAASDSNTVTFVGSAAGNEDKTDLTITWGQLHNEALGMAAILQAKGVKPGDHVALLGPTTRNLVTAIQATWLAGASVSMLPIPMRFNSVEEFANQSRSLMLHGDISLLLLDPALAAFHEVKPGDPPVLLLDELEPATRSPTAADYMDVPRDPDRLAILQFTSGSTSSPKGVMLPYRTLEANVAGMIDASQVVPEDTFVSWLPLYHDMGLVGLLTVPMAVGCKLVLAAHRRIFFPDPADWMRWMHNTRVQLPPGRIFPGFWQPALFAV